MSPFPPKLVSLAVFAGLALALLTITDPMGRYVTRDVEQQP